MFILLVIVVVIYLILGIVFRDKEVTQEIHDEIMQKELDNYLARRKLSVYRRAEGPKYPAWNEEYADLCERERIKRRLINETFLLGVMSGNRLREKREKYIQVR
ncbi:MAG: hypothetical protein KBC69_00445 [Candidatus Magasanikbacteria bacterium]|nr:hypothetical protein [Candidatus Magasanikbacteria bacterium]